MSLGAKLAFCVSGLQQNLKLISHLSHIKKILFCQEAICWPPWGPLGREENPQLLAEDPPVAYPGAQDVQVGLLQEGEGARPPLSGELAPHGCDQRTSLHLAALTDRVDIVSLLIDFDFDIKTLGSTSPLAVALAASWRAVFDVDLCFLLR